MSDGKHTVVGVGELLWDLLPSGKRLGGAPANFAYISNLLGNRGLPASRIGTDDLGCKAVQHLTRLNVNDGFVQRDQAHPTGTVKVRIEEGQPHFEIMQAVAWDFLEWNNPWQQLAREADAVCFGSLAQRSPQNRSTIRSFLNAMRPQALRVFDVNLRQNFYSKEVLGHSIRLATIVKLNHDELPTVLRVLEFENKGVEDAARALLSFFELQLVCVTRGQSGSLLVSQDTSSEHPGFKVKVADTLGAGDAFTAALVHALLEGASLPEMNDRANRMGAWVATQTGGMPIVQDHGIERILAEIG